MFYIDDSEVNVSDAREYHLINLKCYINRKIGSSNCSDGSCIICNSKIRKISKLDSKISAFLLIPNHIDDILKGSPSKLFDISEEFWKSIFPLYDFQTWLPYFDRKNISKKSKSPYKKESTILFKVIDVLNKIFDYERFIDKGNIYYNAYDLTKALSRNTCTYCNRTYTTTIIKKSDGTKIIRPTLDHWFPKSQFPLLSVSFYNLIPCCSNCNSSVKGATTLNLKDFTHPYVDVSQNEDFKFGFFYSSKIDRYKIFLTNSKYSDLKSRNTLKKMFIDEMYNTHHSELRDLILIKKNYSKSYVSSLEKLFGGKLTKPEVYRILFGVEYNSKNFYKLPLSKFKNDILKQLEIID